MVIDEIDDAVELKVRLGVCGGEERDIIPVPAFVAGPDGVRTVNVGQHVAPMIAVLDEVAQGKAGAEACAERGDVYDRHGEVAAGGREALDAVIAEISLVDDMMG